MYMQHCVKVLCDKLPFTLLRYTVLYFYDLQFITKDLILSFHSCYVQCAVIMEMLLVKSKTMGIYNTVQV